MNGRRHALVIVEDHEATRRAMSRLLASEGWQVRSAGTVAEGLDLLTPEPDCLILDLMLPDGDGESILRRVREAGLQTRVAVTTGEGDEARLEAVRRLRPDALLRKPVDFGEVCRTCEGRH
jgi:DNA-binding response OmpR family regulator